MQIIKYKDGNGYLVKDDKNGHRRITDEYKATRFSDGEAEKFIRNRVRKLFRDRLEIINISEPMPIAYDEEGTNDAVILEKSVVNTQFNSLDFDWCSELKREDEFRKQLDIYSNNLPIMLSNTNNEICDIEHYIEFNSFSACEGYKLCKLLKEKREFRRKIKDEMAVVEILYRDWIDEHDATNVYRAIESRDGRIYTPRALPELFGCEKQEIL